MKLSRISIWLGIIVILILGYFVLVPAWPGLMHYQLDYLSMLQEKRDLSEDLPRIHQVLTKSHSIQVKIKALTLISRYQADESINILISELDYTGRWWVSWWDYEEQNDAEAYRSVVSDVLRRYGSRATPSLLALLNEGTTIQRYEAVGILGYIEPNTAQINKALERSYDNDPDKVVRIRAAAMIERIKGK